MLARVLLNEGGFSAMCTDAMYVDHGRFFYSPISASGSFSQEFLRLQAKPMYLKILPTRPAGLYKRPSVAKYGTQPASPVNQISSEALIKP